MSRPRSRTRFGVQTKVLIPVVSIMVLLVVAPMSVVSRQMSHQLESGAADNLKTADAVFRNLQGIRAKNLLTKSRHVPTEPRFQAVALKGDPKTVEFLLNELLDELGGDILCFADGRGGQVARVSRQEDVNLNEFIARSDGSVRKALQGEANVDTISVGHQIYDVVCHPASIGTGGDVVGVLTVGTRLGAAAAAELKELTRSEIILLAGDRIAVATLESSSVMNELHGPLLEIYTGEAARRRRSSRLADTITVNGEHFMYLIGQLGETGAGPLLGYVLLSSYEKPLRVLQTTQNTFLWIQLAGISFGTVLVWLLVRRVTRPLRELRDNAEAVGRGDFSRRAEVASQDECGELAKVFNQMTANLKSSREELEKTVDTLKNTQAQLVHSEKLRAIGTLAGGIAHDFNNILGAILGFGELVLEDVPAHGRTARNVRQIIKAGQRARELVRQILTFSRRAEPQRSRLRLSAIMDETLRLLSATIPATVNIQSRITAANDAVVADATQLHQVLMNLGTNANHAMRARGGTLRLTLQDYVVTRSGSVEAPRLVPGDYLRLDVADTGHGMDQAVLERIFEPFFTTKPVGEGTGLGLSVVHGIVEQHGGEITVVSQPGQGTTFSIFLPCAGPADDAAAESEEPVAGNHERILVVDDEEALVNMLQQKLTRLGYEVVAHHDSRQALEAFQGAPHTFDLVITDQTMPRLTGGELAREILRIRPDTPIILCSGAGSALIESRQPTVRECVLKPVNFCDLSRSIRRVLERPTPNLEGKQP